MYANLGPEAIVEWTFVAYSRINDIVERRKKWRVIEFINLYFES